MKKTLIVLLTFITAFINSEALAINRVLSLDGDGDYVEISDSESLNALNSQVTMEAWFKVKAFKSQWMPIIYKGDMLDWDNRSYSLWLDCNYRRLLLDSEPGGQMPITIWSPVDSIALDTWYHVVGVIDGKSGVMKILLNGDEVANGLFGRDIRMSSFPLRIGWTHEEDKRFSPFVGQIDEVRIWNIARAEGEIQATMHTALSEKNQA